MGASASSPAHQGFRPRVGKLAPDSTVMLVCDLQEHYRTRIYEISSVLHASNSLVQAAKRLCIPVICTTHDAANSDARTPPELHLDDGCSCHDKTVFSMLSADVRRAIDARHPKSIVLCGVEAHVCVLQTCLDLVEDGYQVHVAVDAVSSSTAFLRATALERLKQSGVFLTTVESLVFQWVPDSNHPAFDDMTELNKQHTAIPSAFH
ncbi:hypothetical protein H310_01750 [Aphanomyces invadans]|uniref:Isochorismatase-like domain-containing protein n=1 Tax=Aphanomyces invadans TaxID=157072 RepID=A0A024UNA8_9STRA|nr:hypothetical protein H310_01750 [Aphanomyces invadans]ETW07113.1 hypothetical protein H310_01750 [Aphanomyces invadans]|eukprot:XP_008863206.1 hypothetical protein H310_01750 [Aphanomyces invadans]